MNHRHMIPVGKGGEEPAREVAGACGAQASRPTPLQPGLGERREVPLPRSSTLRCPGPAGFRGATGLTAFSCSSRSFILVPRRPKAGERDPSERVPGELPEVATGPDPGKGAGGGGGRRRRPARRSVRDHGRLRRAASSGPAGAARSKSGSRASGGAQRGSTRGPAPYLGRAPRSSLKGPSPVAARPLSATVTPPALAPLPSGQRRRLGKRTERS